MKSNKMCYHSIQAVLLLFLFSIAVPGVNAKTQFIPSLTITEEYTDNFNQSENNLDDEFSTTYSPGLSFGWIEKTKSFFINYNAQYKDYMDKSEYDAWNHSASINANLQTGKNTILTFSDQFNRSLNRTALTNSFNQHDTNTANLALNHKFGKQDSFNLSYTYTFDDYEDPNQDEFITHRPAASVTYWFAPKYGMDISGAYSKTDYDILNTDPTTINGNIRFLKKINKHFDAYIKYAHTVTDQNTNDYVIYNPSVGFDWTPDKDSSISLGVGYLTRDYQTGSDNDYETIFLDFDAYRNISFSKRNNLAITGSSSYNDVDPAAASLGFTIKYRAGVLHTYQLSRRLTSELNGAYAISQYDSPGTDRTDNTMNLGAGLVWSPKKWLKFNLSYNFTNFNTDDSIRDDYQENKIFLSISLVPSEPLNLNSSSSRKSLEEKIF